MKQIGIISSDFNVEGISSPHSYETKAILLAISAVGMMPIVINPEFTTYGLVNNIGFAAYRSQEGSCNRVDDLSAILVRRTRGMAGRIVDFCQYSQIFSESINVSDSVKSLIGAVSKSYSAAVRSAVVNQPDTYFIVSVEDLPNDILYPVISKPLYGAGGHGVVLCEDRSQLEKALKKVSEYSGHMNIVQERIKIAREFRVLVVGGEPVGCVEKGPPSSGAARNAMFTGAFKSYSGSNLDRVNALACEATQAMGYDICGVDILDSDSGLYVLECNRSPQFMAFDSALRDNTCFDTSIAANAIARFLRKSVD
jgi:glutathione synthase/RimK-type ligase-like ATP-grasp enzyme